MSFWDVGGECFIIQGQHVEITLRDVYFLTGLPMLGVFGNMAPKLSHGESLDDICERHYYASMYVCGSYILYFHIESLSTRVVVVMVLRILGSSGNHKISGGQLQMVESAMGGTYFGWAQMYLFIV